jgi:uncharacterized protein (TIGR03435 family)
MRLLVDLVRDNLDEMRLKCFGTVLIAVAGLAAAQDGTEPQFLFEVASVKVSGPQSRSDVGGGPGTSDPGQFHYNSATLFDLIDIAYHVKSFQVISKLPLERGKFDITAKVPAGTTRDQFGVMMQNLLAERFHLEVHKDSREFPAWEMIIAKSGLKLKESAIASETDQISGPTKVGDHGFPVLPANRPGDAIKFTVVDGFIVGRLTAQQQPVSSLTRNFLGSPDPPIMDRTGLTGKYDFKLEFSRELTGAPSTNAKVPPVPDLFTAVQQQLGLQFVPKKLPFDVVVVESVDLVPTEN